MPTTYDPGDFPGPLGSDAADGPAQIGALATRLASLLTAVTTAQRNALTGDDLWAGRRVWNVTTGQLEVYTGSAWQAVADLSAHTSASDPHTGYVRKATATAKGDLFVATASGVIARKAVGADGRVLTADSAQSDGLAWTDLSGTYQPLDADLTAIAALSTQAFGRSLLTQADAAAARSTLGVTASAMTLISEQVLGADAATVTFSSIAGTYKSLLLEGWLRGSGTLDRELMIRLNGLSTSIYDTTLAFVQNGSGSFAELTGQSSIRTSNSTVPPQSASFVGGFEFTIANYANASLNKAGRLWTVGRAAGTKATVHQGSWDAALTAAITSISVQLSSDSIEAGSTFRLYGIGA